MVVGIGVEGGIGRASRVTTSDLWTIDVGSGEATRLTSNGDAASATWFPDGRRIAYLKAVAEGFEIWSARADGSAPPARLMGALSGVPYAMDLAPDGRFLVARITDRRSSGALVRVALEGDARTDTLVRAIIEGVRPEHPRISPDGRWVSYIDRTTYEVWVRSLRDSSVLMVSTTNSSDSPAIWGPDSRTLYYRSSEGLSVIELQTAPQIAVSRRRAIRSLPANAGFDIAPDGKTFAMVIHAQGADGVVVAVDWATEARRAWRGSASK